MDMDVDFEKVPEIEGDAGGGGGGGDDSGGYSDSGTDGALGAAAEESRFAPFVSKAQRRRVQGLQRRLRHHEAGGLDVRAGGKVQEQHDFFYSTQRARRAWGA